MHELSIATNILDAVKSEAARLSVRRVGRIGIRIGAFSAVDGDSLRFCFDALVRDTDLAATELEIEQTPGEELDIAWLEVEDGPGPT